MEQVTLIKISLEELKNIVVEAVNQVLNERNKSQEKRNDPETVNMDGICDRYKWRKPTVYGWIHHRLIPHSKMGKHLYFNIAEIEKWIASGRRKTVAEIEAEADTYLANNRYSNFGKKRR